MKQKINFLFYQLLLMLMLLPLQASAQNNKEINQIQLGKEEIVVGEGDVITFKDYKGDDNLRAFSDKAQAVTVFKPGVKGKVIKFTFNIFDLRTESGWPGYVNIYSGVADPENTFVFAESVSDIMRDTDALPEGNFMEKRLEGNFTDRTYFSTADDGSLSIGFMYNQSCICSGFEATVELVTPEDMQISASSSQYADVQSAISRKINVPFAGIHVETKGFHKPDVLTKIVFNAVKNDNAVDVTKMRLYKGRLENIDFKTATSIDVTINKLDATHFEMLMNESLVSGNNDYTLVGDFLQDAAIGSEVCIEADKIISEKASAGYASFEKGEAVTVTVPAIEIMQAGNTTVNVGSTPIKFFDNGGVEGKSLISEGITTFVPSVEGKKVMIDFTKVNLFMGYDGVKKESLRIYNGKEAKEENLIKIITETNTCLVRSTSADGALTVKYTDGETAEYSKKDGFEAEVSLFTPQPMQFDGVTVERINGGNVCAGTEGVQVLKICINTSNTEPLLKADKFEFTTNNTFGIISKAHLYYTKGNDKFGIVNEVGSADITADNFSITAAQPYDLVEGANYFWLAYDIRPNAQNNQKIGASAVNVKLSDALHTIENGNPEGELIIENVVISKENAQDYTVYGSVEFKTDGDEYSHEGGLTDQVTVFRPATKGKVLSLDFTSFDIRYDPSEYGTRAKLIIYNGDSSKGNVLWKLDSPDKAKTGPEKILRSSTVTGAITIVFNPNTSSSYSCGKGFTATVSEYENKPMELDSVEVMQAPEVTVGVGDKNIRILDIDVHTSGNQGMPSFEEITLDLKGSEKCVSKVMLYSNSSERAAVAEKEITDKDKTVVLSLPAEVLVEGKNLYNLRFDLGANAKGGEIIDAAVTSVKVSGSTTAVKNGDPEGSFEVKNIYCIKSGDNGEKIISEGSSMSFFDDGGADGNASDNFEGIIKFAPDKEGNAVVLDFKEFSASNSDHMYIWYGENTEGNADFDFSLYGDPKPLDITPLVSKSADGKFTVKFVTGNYPRSGFNISVSSKERKPLEVAGVTATAVAPEGVLKGETDVPMIKIAVNVEGDHKTAEINKFELGTYTGDIISDVKIYATGMSESFSTANLFGTNSKDKNNVEGSYVAERAGMYYFFVTADVNTIAAQDAAVNVSLKGVNGNTAEVKAETKVIKGISGTLTVGAGEEYNNIQDAVNALKAGVDGPVTINIKPGIYKECVKVPEIKGASVNNTITMRSESGNYKDVRIYSNVYNKPAEYKDYYGTFTIDGADYFTLRGVEVTTENTEYESLVHIKNHAQHVTVDSCYIHTKVCSSYDDGDASLIKTYAENIENRNNDYLTVTNCLLEGGYIGVYACGTGFVKLPKQYEALVKGNKFVNQGFASVYGSDQLGIKIIDNVITNDASKANEFKAIDVKVRDTSDYDVEISGNRINVTADTKHTLLYIREMNVTEEHPARIYNNELISNGGSSSSYVVSLGSDQTSNLEFAYNTITMNSVSATPVVYVSKKTNGNVSFVNNIVVNRQADRIFFFGKDAADGIKFDSNVFATESESFATMNGEVKTYDEFVAETSAVGCYKENVTFVNDNVLEPKEQGSLLNAKTIEYVKKDITGVERNAETPTIGAYEFNASVEAPVMAADYPAIKNITDSTAVIVVKTDLSGKAYVLAVGAEAEAPAADSIKSAGVSADVIRAKENEIVVEGLVKDSTYRAYVIVESYRGTTGAVAKTYAFKASGEQIIEIPDPIVIASDVTAEKGTKAVLKANVTTGKAPYTVEWKDNLNNVISTSTLDADGETSVEVDASECNDYKVFVTDSYKKKASARVRLTVTGEAVTATFENLYLDKESYWNGSDLSGSFVSGSYKFNNVYTEAWKSWTGCAYSNITTTEFKGYNDPSAYANVTGSGYDGSANYATMFCMMPADMEVMNNAAEGDSIRGMYITNAPVTVKSITEGDAFAKKFEKGDYLTLNITDSESGKKVEYYLADYRSENEADRYYLDTWQWVDLSSLGKVKKLVFTITGSDTGDMGLNTPAYFCMDNFNGKRVVKEVPVQLLDVKEFDATLDVAQFFTLDNNNATVNYTLEEVTDKGDFEITLKGSELVVKGKADGEFKVVVKAVQKGKIQFVSIPVTFTTSLEGVDTDEYGNVKYRYTIDGKRINTNSRQQGINIIRSNEGKVKKVVVR